MHRSVLAIFAVFVCVISAAAAAQQPSRGAKPAAAVSTEVVNLNSSTPAQIAALPGIGPKTAELIVQYREKNGPFKKIEEIMNVKGVGEKSFLRIKDRLTVAAVKAEK